MIPAYIDPGTGSFVFQAIVAIVAGAAVTVRAYWSRIKRLFGAKDAEESRAPDPSEATRDDD